MAAYVTAAPLKKTTDDINIGGSELRTAALSAARDSWTVGDQTL